MGEVTFTAHNILDPRNFRVDISNNPYDVGSVCNSKKKNISTTSSVSEYVKSFSVSTEKQTNNGFFLIMHDWTELKLKKSEIFLFVGVFLCPLSCLKLGVFIRNGLANS